MMRRCQAVVKIGKPGGLLRAMPASCIPRIPGRGTEGDCFRGLSENDSIKILAMTGRQRRVSQQPKCPFTAGQPFRAKEQRTGQMLSIESVRQIVQMGHAEDLDFQLQQGANNLSGDFRPSRSLVEANDSFRRRMLPGATRSTIALILPSSSSSFPLFMPASSSRLKCVNTPLQTLARNDSAATNIPHCIIS